jgi:ribosomal-protein-alanine N-acetyltransferase
VGGEAVGSVGLFPKSDIECLSAEIGYWIGESCWGKGNATAAVMALRSFPLIT